MSERVLRTAEATAADSAEPVDTPAGLRFDPPHVSAHAVEPPADPAPLPTAASDVTSPEERLLLQASQIAEHLRRKSSDLDRREQRLNLQAAELDQERRTLRLWSGELDQELQDRGGDLDARAAELIRRETLTEEIAAALQDERRDFQRRQSELERSIAAFEQAQVERQAEWERAQQGRRDDLEREIAELRVARIEALEAELATLGAARNEWDAERRRQQLELAQERLRLDNRLRFQEEHLRKTRSELEAEQRELAGARQRFQTTRAGDDERHDLRRRQLDAFRDLLDRREQLIDAALGQAAKGQAALQERMASEEARLAAERARWEQERSAQQADLARQQDMLAAHAGNLEARHARLDRLRAELEETHRETLDLRVCVEEVCAQITQALGTEPARARIAAARGALSAQYQQIRDSLVQQRAELEALRAQLQTERDEFRAERQTLTEWIAQRDHELSGVASELTQARRALDVREQQWEEMRAQWRREKTEAERVIRDLLRQQTEPLHTAWRTLR